MRAAAIFFLFLMLTQSPFIARWAAHFELVVSWRLEKSSPTVNERKKKKKREIKWARSGSALNGQPLTLEESEEFYSRVGTPLICASLVKTRHPSPLSGTLGQPGKRTTRARCAWINIFTGTFIPLSAQEYKVVSLIIWTRFLTETSGVFRLLSGTGVIPFCYFVWNIWGLNWTLLEERKTTLWKFKEFIYLFVYLCIYYYFLIK